MIVLSVCTCVFARLLQTHLLLMKHHLALKRAAQCSHSDERLPHSADGPGKDIIQLNGLQRVCPLTHGVQWHGVTRRHINHICKNNNKLACQHRNIQSFETCLEVVRPLELYHNLEEKLMKVFKVSQQLWNIYSYTCIHITSSRWVLLKAGSVIFFSFSYSSRNHNPPLFKLLYWLLNSYCY